MTDYEFLQVVSGTDCRSVRELLEYLEARIPAVRIFDADDEIIVAFPLPCERKHSVSIRDCRAGDGPRVWVLSARAGTLEGLVPTGFSIGEYNSQADLGLAVTQESIVLLRTQIIKAHSCPLLAVVTAYNLARQADALERRVGEKDEL